MFLNAKRRFHNNVSSEAHHHPFAAVHAWIGAVECTFNSGEGYNVHQHMLIGSRAERISYVRIRELWDRIGFLLCGTDRSMTHITPMTHDKGATGYIAKYISKGTWGGLSRGRAYAHRNVLMGKNRIGRMRGTSRGTGVTAPVYALCCISGATQRCDNPSVSDPPDFLVDLLALKGPTIVEE